MRSLLCDKPVVARKLHTICDYCKQRFDMSYSSSLTSEHDTISSFFVKSLQFPWSTKLSHDLAVNDSIYISYRRNYFDKFIFSLGITVPWSRNPRIRS